MHWYSGFDTRCLASVDVGLINASTLGVKAISAYDDPLSLCSVVLPLFRARFGFDNLTIWHLYNRKLQGDRLSFVPK